MCIYISLFLQSCLEYVSLRAVTPDTGERNTATGKLYQISASSHSAGEHMNGSDGPWSVKKFTGLILPFYLKEYFLK